MSKTIVANWKMNFNPHEASLLVHRLSQKIEHKAGTTVVLCPPMLDIYPLSKDLDKAKFQLGSQNVHHLDEGPHTGEVSSAMLAGLVKYAIVGHSERRREAGEDDKLIAKKVAACLRHGITPILCVGDTLLDRQHGHSLKVVNDQVSANLAMVTAEELKDVVIAYEPVWAISSGDGKGTFAKPDEVTPIVKAIRNTLSELYGEGAGVGSLILYGGSVNPDNASAYLKLDGVDGLLVGGASLNYEQFASIVASAQKIS